MKSVIALVIRLAWHLVNLANDNATYFLQRKPSIPCGHSSDWVTTGTVNRNSTIKLRSVHIHVNITCWPSYAAWCRHIDVDTWRIPSTIKWATRWTVWHRKTHNLTVVNCSIFSAFVPPFVVKQKFLRRQLVRLIVKSFSMYFKSCGISINFLCHRAVPNYPVSRWFVYDFILSLFDYNSLTHCYLWPLSLTWFDFNPGMDK